MLGVVGTGEGAVYFFFSVLFCQIVYSQEVTEIIVGFPVTLSVAAIIDRLTLNQSVPIEYE